MTSLTTSSPSERPLRRHGLAHRQAVAGVPLGQEPPHQQLQGDRDRPGRCGGVPGMIEDPQDHQAHQDGAHPPAAAPHACRRDDEVAHDPGVPGAVDGHAARRRARWRARGRHPAMVGGPWRRRDRFCGTHCRRAAVGSTHASRHRSRAPRGAVQGRCPTTPRAATSPRRSPRSPSGSRAASRTSSCSAPPAPARPRPWRGWPSRCSGRSWSCSPTRPWPPSSPTSCASCSPTTPSSTSSPTTTTTSPRPTSPRPTPTSRRTPRSTRRSSGCATRRPTRC